MNPKWFELTNWANNPARTRGELQTACGGLGLARAGGVAALRTRLQAFIAGQVDQNAEAPWRPAGWAPVAPVVFDRDHANAWTNAAARTDDELKKALHVLGEPFGGTRVELLARLVAKLNGIAHGTDPAGFDPATLPALPPPTTRAQAQVWVMDPARTVDELRRAMHTLAMPVPPATSRLADLQALLYYQLDGNPANPAGFDPANC